MARRTKRDRTFVITGATGINLLDTPGDVATGMLCPGEGAMVVRVSYTMKTPGTGTQNHNLTLEHGLGAAGVALTGIIDVLADAVAGIIVTGDGLPYQSHPLTVEGTQIQILNAEEGAISDGAILDISILWQL